MNEQEKNVNKYYFGGVEQFESMNPKDQNGEALKFIILQNDQLHAEKEKMETEVKELKDELIELESANDSMEKTRNCLRGYIKNEHEIAAEYKNLCCLTVKQHKLILGAGKLTLIMLIINMIISFFFFDYHNYYTWLLMMSSLLIPFFMIRSNYLKINKKIALSYQRLKETEKASTYLDDLIDNM